MNLKLIQFQSTDQIILPGLLYEPMKRTKRALIWLHGCGSTSVFYSVDRMNALAQEFISAGIAFFPFNNRGAHTIKSLKRFYGKPQTTNHKQQKEDEYERIKMGTAYELIRECEYDIEGAINYLESQGYEQFYLAGSSTGANKICIYNYYKPENRIAKYILISGGDDTGLYYQSLGRKKYYKVLKICKKMIEKGRGEELIPIKLIGDMIYSYQAFYDTINPDGDYNIFPYLEESENLGLAKKELFREIKSITKPTQIIYGKKDEYLTTSVEEIERILVEKLSNFPNFDIHYLDEGNHDFSGMEVKLASLIIEWLLR